MAATLTPKSKMIQHTFDWECNSDSLVGHDLVTSESAASLAVMEPTSHAAARRQPTSATTSPTPLNKPTHRRNRCEHVGGVMATVLSNYGLGVDDLLHAIDNLRMARSQASSVRQP